MGDIDVDTCAVIFGMLDDYVDRELTGDEIRRVERHLETCAVCAAEFRFEESVLRRIRAKLQRIAVPPGLHARVWGAVMARHRERDPGD